MNREDREALSGMLADLICAQDSVTHMNEQGLEHKYETRNLISKRNVIKIRILDFVDKLVGRGGHQ